MAARICAIINERGLTQTEAAKILDVNQPKISALMSGKFDGFSSDRLLCFLNALNQNVEIIIKPNPHLDTQAKIQVH